MSAVQSALVVGGGVAGTAAAILLADAGINVELVEIWPSVTALGSGITLQGNSLRVFRQLGVLDECLHHGYAFDTLKIRSAGPNPGVLGSVESVPSGGADLPSTMGMYRPDLAAILIRRAEDAGATIRTGVSPRALADDGQGVNVTFTDNSVGRYDLVVAADGIHSSMRDMLGLKVEERETGLGIWRVFAPRPPEVTGAELFYGGSKCIYAGYTPTSETSLYAHITEDAQDRSGLSPAEQIDVIRQLSSDLHGPWDAIRDSVVDASQINYTRTTTHLLPAPWNKGRTVVIGDAAHTCPPTIAQGAAMGLEDASVLVELLVAHDDLTDEVWDKFMQRRFERARTVVDSSHQIGQWQRNREEGDVPALMSEVLTLVSEPA